MRALALALALLAPAAARAQPAPPAPQPRIHPDASTAGYDARVEDSFQAAESFQGPLDGGWTLAAKDGGPLFSIRFADHAGKLEAAWRDLRRGPGALNASGVVDEAAREGDRLTLRFSATAGVAETVTLTAGKGGAWAGDLDEAGHRRAVTLTKTSP